MASDELEQNSISCKRFLILSFAKDFCCWGSLFSWGDREKPLLIGVSEVGAEASTWLWCEGCKCSFPKLHLYIMLSLVNFSFFCLVLAAWRWCCHLQSHLRGSQCDGMIVSPAAFSSLGATLLGPQALSVLSFFSPSPMASGVSSMFITIGVTRVMWVKPSSLLNGGNSLASFSPMVEKCSLRISALSWSDVTILPSCAYQCFFFLGHQNNVCCHFVFAATTAYIYGHSAWSISVMSWQLRAILREAATRCNCRVQCCLSRTRFYSCSIACNIARNNFRGGHATCELLNTGGKMYCSHNSSNMTKVWLLCCKGQHVASWCSQDNGDSYSPRQRRTSGKMVLVVVSVLWAGKK